MVRHSTNGTRRDRRVLACIPYFHCRRYIRRAVLSMLNQTHRDMTVVVINDGDPQPPWDLLADIADSRLVRFTIAANYGPYFANAIALNATSAPYFLMQDADDWSVPTRASELLDRLEAEGSDLAVSAQPQYVETAHGQRIFDVRWAGIAKNGSSPHRFTVNLTLGPEFAYRAPHAGLFRSDSIRRVGGYYGGFRIGYDTILTNHILMTGRISHVANPLYFRLARPDSLTHSPLTGSRSAIWSATTAAIESMYKHSFFWYSLYIAGKIDSECLGGAIRNAVARNITAASALRLEGEAQKLKQVFQAQRIEPV
ncbi:MAG: glycosyltransferase family 2 protein [Silvibacterium sp.]|nr:glycosyltransferase family 2 protein [Silvibacterium sp.]